MILEEIPLGEDVKSKRDVILKNLNKQVILKVKDTHYSVIHGYLTGSTTDITYMIDIADPRGRTQLFYHNLQQLILLKPHKDFPLPRIKLSPGHIRK